MSAALAAVIERATAKDLERRYATDAELIAELEDAMAIETARSGSVTGRGDRGPAHAARHARRRLPFRLRHPGWLAALVLAGVAVAGVGAYELSRQAQRGTGAARRHRRRDWSAWRWARRRQRLRPRGRRQRAGGETGAVLDGNVNTTWSTERYDGGLARQAGRGHLRRRPARGWPPGRWRCARPTPGPGWRAEVYAAREGPPEELDGWTRISGPRRVTRSKEKIDLDSAGQRFRYYLLWITELPPSGQVKLSELYLSR